MCVPHPRESSPSYPITWVIAPWRGVVSGGRTARVWGGGHPPDIGKGGQWEQAGTRKQDWEWELGGWSPPESSLGVCKSPGPPREETGGVKLCLVQCVSACRGGDPGGVRVVAEGGFPAPKVPLSPFQLWGVPRGFLCMCTVAACRCLAGVRVAASPPSWGLYFVCVSVCLC